MRGRRLTGARTCGGRRALPAAQIQRGEARGGGRGGRKEGAVRGRGGGWEPRRRGGHGIGAAVCVHTCPPVSRPSAVCECRLPVAPGGSHVHTSRSHSGGDYDVPVLPPSLERGALRSPCTTARIYTQAKHADRAHAPLAAAPARADPRTRHHNMPTAPMHWRKSVPTVPRVLISLSLRSGGRWTGPRAEGSESRERGPDSCMGPEQAPGGPGASHPPVCTRREAQNARGRQHHGIHQTYICERL